MSPPQPPRVDPKIWQLCAGPSTKIPKIHSKVYYFPQGHLEHACSSPSNNTLAEAAAEKKKKGGKDGQLEVEGDGFSWRGKKGKLTEKAVIDAVELAEKNRTFEVVYYPRPNWCDFVVDANVVDDAMKIGWASGMRVKLPLKKDEFSNSKTILYHPQATISNVCSVLNWRMLEVNWDEPKISQSPNRVNPWQVELIPQTPTSYLPFPSIKKPRLAQDSTLISDKKGNPSIPFLTIESLKETLWNMGTTLVETNNNAKSNVNPPGSIKLFGKIIHPVKSNVHDSGTKEEAGCKGCNDIEDK